MVDTAETISTGKPSKADNPIMVSTMTELEASKVTTITSVFIVCS